MVSKRVVGVSNQTRLSFFFFKNKKKRKRKRKPTSMLSTPPVPLFVGNESEMPNPLAGKPPANCHHNFREFWCKILSQGSHYACIFVPYSVVQGSCKCWLGLPRARGCQSTVIAWNTEMEKSSFRHLCTRGFAIQRCFFFRWRCLSLADTP